MAKLFKTGLAEAARLVAALAILVGAMWGIVQFGDGAAEKYVSLIIDGKKLETVASADEVRKDVAAIVADRKELTAKRQSQFDDVARQISTLSIKIEGIDQRISTQLQGLITLTERLNDRLDWLNDRLPLRTGKYQDRIGAEGEP